MNEFIFRKYDIRGIVKSDFHDDVVQKNLDVLLEPMFQEVEEIRLRKW